MPVGRYVYVVMNDADGWDGDWDRCQDSSWHGSGAKGGGSGSSDIYGGTGSAAAGWKYTMDSSLPSMVTHACGARRTTQGPARSEEGVVSARLAQSPARAHTHKAAAATQEAAAVPHTSHRLLLAGENSQITIRVTKLA